MQNRVLLGPGYGPRAAVTQRALRVFGATESRRTVGGRPYCLSMDSTDWWGLIWQGVGAAWSIWAQVFAMNPWPWLGLFALALLSVLIPAWRHRRRS